MGALCTGVAMLGVSVNGLLGVDAELQRSTYAARQHHTVDYHSVRVLDRYGDCDKAQPPSRTRT